MKQAIIIHGTPSKESYFDPNKPSEANKHWLPWLKRQLQLQKWEVHTPEVHLSYAPTYEKWLKELNRFQLDENTSLVGHSCGGGFLVRYLTENPDVKLDKVILVAPWLNPDNWKETEMFEFEIRDSITQQANEFYILNSSDDMETIKKSLELVRSKLTGFQEINFENMGHFCKSDMGTEEFPELLKLLVQP